MWQQLLSNANLAEQEGEKTNNVVRGSSQVGPVCRDRRVQ